MARVEDPLQVTVAYGPQAGSAVEVAVWLPAGATLADAVHASTLLALHPEIDLALQPLGVWGRRRQPEERVRDRDRVEIYRPLAIDPKQARRKRHQVQQARERG